MATPNYGYEKRQKELAKKRKKEDKLKNKSERKGSGEEDAGTPEHGDSPSDATQTGGTASPAAAD